MKHVKFRMILMIILTSSYMFVEIIIGQLYGSLTLTTDAFHMVSDLLALTIGFVSLLIGEKEVDHRYTYGYKRMEILGALVNSVFLSALCFSLLVSSITRFFQPEDVANPDIVVYVGIGGLVVNVIGLAIFHQHGHSKREVTSAAVVELEGDVEMPTEGEGATRDLGVTNPSQVISMPTQTTDEGSGLPDSSGTGPTQESRVKKVSHNIQGVFLHLLGDMLGSIGVVISGLLIWLTNLEDRYKRLFDPCFSIIIILIISVPALRLAFITSRILLQRVPSSIDVRVIRNEIEQLPYLKEINYLNIWQHHDEEIVGTINVTCTSDDSQIRLILKKKIKDIYANHGVNHFTVQID